MPHLTWISDQNLSKHVHQLLTATQFAKTLADTFLHTNVIDPFSAIFQMSGFGMDYNEWIKSEEARQAQKTMQNHVGTFHQNILGSCNGWQNMNTGNNVDLVNATQNIIAEVKNKHNTISGGALSDLYYRLGNLVMPNASAYKNYTAYYVAVIPKKPVPYNITFTPSDKANSSKCASNVLIRSIDGASFYSMVTGSNTALEDLFNVIPAVIGNFNAQQIADMVHLQTLYKMAYG